MISKIKRKILRVLHKNIDFTPIKLDGHLLKMNHQHREYWKRVENGSWEPETFEILSKFLKPSSFYCDIGAWIGPTVTYASKKCKKVICFEPDPYAYRYLVSNILENNLSNVSSFNVGLSNETSILKMSSFGGTLGDSMTSLLTNNPLKENSSKEFDAFIVDWEYAVKTFKLEKLDMIKIDIEGAEFNLIPRMKEYFIKYKPIIWLSLHPLLLDKNQKDTNLKKIIEVMSIYKKCYNSKLQLVNIKEILTDENKNSYPEFLFTD